MTDRSSIRGFVRDSLIALQSSSLRNTSFPTRQVFLDLVAAAFTPAVPPLNSLTAMQRQVLVANVLDATDLFILHQAGLDWTVPPLIDLDDALKFAVTISVLRGRGDWPVRVADSFALP